MARGDATPLSRACTLRCVFINFLLVLARWGRGQAGARLGRAFLRRGEGGTHSGGRGGFLAMSSVQGVAWHRPAARVGVAVMRFPCWTR